MADTAAHIYTDLRTLGDLHRARLLTLDDNPAGTGAPCSTHSG